MKKMQSMKLSKYFELIKPEYQYIKIEPHKSIRNGDTSAIAKAIASTYRSLDKRIRIQKKKLFFQSDFKISHVIDITKDEVNFYFIVPKNYTNLIMDKLASCWPKATIHIVDEKPKAFTKEAEVYEVSYSKEDALSLKLVDKRKTAEPLNQILSVLNIMEEDDRVTVVYNFLPCSQFNWGSRYAETMDKIAKNKLVLKKQTSTEYVFKSMAVSISKLFSDLLKVLDDFTGGNPNKGKEDFYASVARAITQQKPLSSSTSNKKHQTIVDGQITIISESKDAARKTTNGASVCQSFRALDEDNSLIYTERKSKEPIDLEDLKIGTEINTFSCDEASNFLQIPGRTLLTQFNIKHVKTEETPVPNELQIGNKRYGEVKYKDTKQMAYHSTDYGIGSYPISYVGCQNSGKTTALKHLTKDCINANEGVIILDFIKACEYSEAIIPIVPKDKLVVINLAKEEQLQGFGFNELVITDDMSSYTKCDLASKQSQQIMSFIDSISTEDNLTRRMRKYLNAACMICALTGHNSIKNIVDCLSYWEIRHQYINELSEELTDKMKNKISLLYELDDKTKPKDGGEPEIIGNKDNKVEFILDRISLLEEDFKLSYMYEKDLTENIDLVDCMNKGKVVIIQMRADDFPGIMAKNIMTTYWISKIWLACQIRGAVEYQPKRCNVFIDEIFQAPISMNLVKYIIPQTRKVGLKFVFSTQYLSQIEPIFDALEGSGGTFMLLSGSTEKDFNYFKGKLDNFEYEDLRDMPSFSSMCIIKYDEGYTSFIAKLPYDKDLADKKDKNSKDNSSKDEDSKSNVVDFIAATKNNNK